MGTAHVVVIEGHSIRIIEILDIAALGVVVAVRPAHMILVPAAVGNAYNCPALIGGAVPIIIYRFHQFVGQQQRVGGPRADAHQCHLLVVDNGSEVFHACRSERSLVEVSIADPTEVVLDTSVENPRVVGLWSDCGRPAAWADKHGDGRGLGGFVVALFDVRQNQGVKRNKRLAAATAARGRVAAFIGELAVGIVKRVEGNADLMEIVFAPDARRRFANFLHGWQQQTDQYSDDRDHHQQFHQCETSSSRETATRFHETSSSAAAATGRPPGSSGDWGLLQLEENRLQQEIQKLIVIHRDDKLLAAIVDPEPLPAGVVGVAVGLVLIGININMAVGPQNG